MKVLLATRNPGKIKVYRKYLLPSVELVTLAELGLTQEFEEKEKTFEANARAKAQFYFNLSGLFTIAEDSGFEIDYFHGEPGVKSRRWLGHQATDAELVDHLRTIIPTIPQDRRTARFVAVSCLMKSAEKIYCAHNAIEGFVSNDIRPVHQPGFPYNTCFIAKDFNKHIEDLTPAEIEKVGHRFINIQSLNKYL